jgi:predicted RNase H-like nuclease
LIKFQLLKGQALKTNEDALDAIVCLYIAGLYAINHRGKTFGDLDLGYIWVPSGSLL